MNGNAFYLTVIGNASVAGAATLKHQQRSGRNTNKGEKLIPKFRFRYERELNLLHIPFSNA
jgi:hypothetical protein